MRYSLFAGGKRMRPRARARGGSSVRLATNPPPCRSPAPSSAFTPTRSCMTICPRWTMTIMPRQIDEPQSFRRRRGGARGRCYADPAHLKSPPQCKSWQRYSHLAKLFGNCEASGSLQLIAGQVADLEGEGKKLPPINSATFTSARPSAGSAVPRGSAA